jgi:hypothetical protein
MVCQAIKLTYLSLQLLPFLGGLLLSDCMVKATLIKLASTLLGAVLAVTSAMTDQFAAP